MISPKCRKYSLYTSISTLRVPSDVLEKLRLHDVRYTSQLLEAGYTPHMREDLASKTHIPRSTIDNLISRADLMRLRGVGADISLLLTEAGVTSCRTLHQQNAEHLYQRLSALHEERRIGYHASSFLQVRSFVNEATLLAETSPEE